MGGRPVADSTSATVQGLHRFTAEVPSMASSKVRSGNGRKKGNFCSCGAAVGGGAAAHGLQVIRPSIAILGRVGHVVARMHVAASGDEQAVPQIDDAAGVLSVCLGSPGDGVRRMGTAPGGCHAVDVFHIHALEAVGLVQRRRNSNDHGGSFCCYRVGLHRSDCF